MAEKRVSPDGTGPPSSSAVDGDEASGKPFGGGSFISVQDHKLTLNRLIELIKSLSGGIVIEDDNRKVAMCNQAFVDMFGIPAPPEALCGADCVEAAKASAPLFMDPEGFLQGIETLLKNKVTVVGEQIELKDGRTVERDYVTIHVDDKYVGHMYHYRDVTARVNLENSLKEEKEKSERLLFTMFNESVVQKLKDGEEVAHKSRAVGVIFLDMVGFTAASAKLSPDVLVNTLTDIFSAFDAVTATYPMIERIKTIGDCYMVTVGLDMTEAVEESKSAEVDRKKKADIARAGVNFCLEIFRMTREKKLSVGQQPLELRCGFHIGPVLAGVIGAVKPVLDVWGDTVNIASRLEHHGHPGMVHVTADVFSLVKNDYEIAPRGQQFIKGVGPLSTFFVKDVLRGIHTRSSSFSNPGDEFRYFDKEPKNMIKYFSVVQHDINQVFAGAVTIMEAAGVPDVIHMNAAQFLGFMEMIRTTYQDVPFHNFYHAVDVTQMAYSLSLLCKDTLKLRPIELAGLLLASYGHDANHPGLDNLFQKTIVSDIAIMYSFEAILENYHLSQVLQCIVHCKIWENMGKDERLALLKVLREAILWTDMSRHGGFMETLKSKEKLEETDEDRMLLIALIMKCADLGNLLRNFPIAKQWCMRLEDEVLKQGDVLRAMGEKSILPFQDRTSSDRMPLPKGQLFFLNTFVIPLYSELARLVPAARVTLDLLQENRSEWERIAAQPPSEWPGQKVPGIDMPGTQPPPLMGVSGSPDPLRMLSWDQKKPTVKRRSQTQDP